MKFFALAITPVFFFGALACKPPQTDSAQDSETAAIKRGQPVPTADRAVAPFVSCLKNTRMDVFKTDQVTKNYEKCVRDNESVLNFEKCSHISTSMFERVPSTFINEACLNVFINKITPEQCYTLTSNSNAGSGSRQDIALKCLNHFSKTMTRMQCESFIQLLSGPVPKKDWTEKCGAMKR
ncbi:MAG: hypothetical protein EBR09_08485 [Proteobacteria bacterium]|nr:hypothetical protein [Pseudomonadota bacterium]